MMMPFEEWAQLRGWMRAAFWRTQGWTNLERGRVSRYTMHQRHWPEEPFLHEFMADLRPTPDDKNGLRKQRRKIK